MALQLLGRPTVGGFPFLIASVAMVASAFAGCTPTQDEPQAAWAGRIDTLANGAVHVANPDEGLWDPSRVPTLVEELRIGSPHGEGPEAFGEVSLLEVDVLGRIWVFDPHAQKLLVFEADGEFVRGVGGRGKGPGEFEMAIGMSWSGEGDLWVLDPANLRFSVFDSGGVLVKEHWVEGGSLITPWPGRFDLQGRLIHYARRRRPGGDGFELVMVRYGPEMTPLDTLVRPAFEPPPIFEHRSGTSYMSAAVPFSPRPTWRLSPAGEVWFTPAREYRLLHLGPGGDTLTIVEKPAALSPVTSEGMGRAEEELRWFTERGGKVDASRIPGVMPAIADFFFAEDGGIWVLPSSEEGSPTPSLDVFDPQGRYLGTVAVPFPFETTPAPVIQGGFFYAVTKDDLDVDFVLRARIRLPSG